MNVDAAREFDRVVHGSTDDPSLLDFSANTNPRVPDGVEAVFREAFDRSRTYPPEPPTAYREAAAAYVDTRPSTVIPTPGGLAAIRLALDLLISAGDDVVVPAPSFGEYAREVRLHGAEPTFVPHDRVLEADPEGRALAIVCQPNNPTGQAYDESAVRAMIARWHEAGASVLVDEAFLGFTDRSSMAGVPGAIVARSLTKLFGLPGIRAGFAVATGPLREAMTGARRPWNVSRPALETGAYCLQQTGFIEETREQVHAERARLRRALATRFEVHPSDAPFLLLDCGTADVSSIITKAREDGVAVRDARTFRGLDSHLRVAVRLPAENDRLIEVLTDG